MTVELYQASPHPALRDAVLRYEGFAQRAPGPVRFRELPGTFVPLILDLGEGWRIGDARAPAATAERLGSFVAGITDGPVMVEHPGTARCLRVDLTPLGARRLLGLPMSELANRSVALEDVIGADAHVLIAQLAAAADWPTRFGLVERALAARLDRAPRADAGVAWALARIGDAGGAVAIGALARDLGWSHRRLIARFRDQVGIAPKATARIVRFERLRTLTEADAAIDWARAAAACGYFDQAHLAREVRDLAGLTPTALRAGAVNFVQDLPGAAALAWP